MNQLYGVYDCGEDGSFDRYTAVYQDGSYIGMSKHPFHPQGFGQHGELKGNWRYDLKTEHFLGKEISFDDLPDDCQRAVKQDLDIFEEG